MSIIEYANKVLGLFRTLRNPAFFLYRLCHYLNRFVPYKLAVAIYKRNIREYKSEGVFDFLLETYDGSGQVVHPDIAYYRNWYWLAVTPYPYGMEEYENPCIYCGESLSSLITPNGPIAVQHNHTQGVHLSDPCFAVNKDRLYCYYRESERKGKIEENTIWSMKYMEKDNSWEGPVLLMQSVDDKILSPVMMFNEKGELIVYYVSTLNGAFTLASTKNKGTISQFSIHSIIGAPKDYDLWHIGITKVKDIQEGDIDSKELAGLFLFKSRQTGVGMKLFETRNDGTETNWHIIKEVEMPVAIRNVVTFPYKSCYIPKQNGKILLSFRDHKSRNRLIIVNNK